MCTRISQLCPSIVSSWGTSIGQCGANSYSRLVETTRNIYQNISSDFPLLCRFAARQMDRGAWQGFILGGKIGFGLGSLIGYSFYLTAISTNQIAYGIFQLIGCGLTGAAAIGGLSVLVGAFSGFMATIFQIGTIKHAFWNDTREPKVDLAHCILPFIQYDSSFQEVRWICQNLSNLTAEECKKIENRLMRLGYFKMPKSQQLGLLKIVYQLKDRPRLEAAFSKFSQETPEDLNFSARLFFYLAIYGTPDQWIKAFDQVTDWIDEFREKGEIPELRLQNFRHWNEAAQFWIVEPMMKYYATFGENIPPQDLDSIKKAYLHGIHQRIIPFPGALGYLLQANPEERINGQIPHAPDYDPNSEWTQLLLHLGRYLFPTVG